LLHHELEVIIKYDGVIRVVEYACDLCRSLYADFDSIRAGMLYLCRECMEGFVVKLGSKFDTNTLADWSADIEEIGQKSLAKKLMVNCCQS
jgi:hypothetical protein